ncbi:hypothetical protein DAPPUDRAFT_320534 [Daphnia pulex]|uniref:FHA domain-containing protein n=1 Tax=Daphnia pulex TaxID=6669 RepID=E9GQ88_DAPPU|nr:hypothetical protein DAPPUDRAFT_320534 [Daphnia pulex]|eukprot:EFX78084.1 hypothetical protein DAPPUDRAFT_320534 [Daphnia pulex]
MEIVSKIRVDAVLRKIGTKDIDADYYECIPLNSDVFTIGRERQSHFCIPDKSGVVSRKHADGMEINGPSKGKNGVAVNRVELRKEQQMSIQHMDTINFGVGNKYKYTFRVQSDSSQVGEEPVAKKRRIPLANRNCPSLKDDGQRVQQLLQENIVLKERLDETMKELERVREELRVQKELNDEK